MSRNHSKLLSDVFRFIKKEKKMQEKLLTISTYYDIIGMYGTYKMVK